MRKREVHYSSPHFISQYDKDREQWRRDQRSGMIWICVIALTLGVAIGISLWPSF